ncbi:MAG: HEAT repeat domain-containing protein, partial [Pirellulales bacterium]|nr:HEAT repeat domain-containing protein [Pirellulales bacterium]
PPKNLDDGRLLEVLSAAAEDDARYVESADKESKQTEKVWSVRERAVFALGMLGTDEANAQLIKYLDSSEPNVRYNAAVGLGRHGKATDRSVAVFVEMLDPSAGLAVETSDAAKSLKRQIVLAAALPAIERIVASDAGVDLTPLEKPLEAVAQQTENKEAQLKAKSILSSLRDRKT